MFRLAAKMDARAKLLDAALSVIRHKGYSASTVDELCAAAGVTKGAFFHHFRSKDALGVAAADHWSETTSALFAEAAYHRHADPLDVVLRIRAPDPWGDGRSTMSGPVSREGSRRASPRRSRRLR